MLGVTGGPVSTFNPYSYVRGNTVNWIDPSGMITGLEVLALTAFVAAASSIITGISSFIGEIAGQLGNNGGNWNCLDIGEAARAARDAALRGGAVGAGVGAIGGGLALAAPWLIPAAGGLASQSPDRVQDVVEVVGDVGEAVGDAITYALNNSNSTSIQPLIGMVDNNVLIQAGNGNPHVIDVLKQYRGQLGLGFQAQQEFLEKASLTELDDILNAYDIRRIYPQNQSAIDEHAQWLRDAFNGTMRVLREGDARVLAEAESLNLAVFTNDQQFAKRIYDLQGVVQYIDVAGGLRAVSRAAINVANYSKNPQIIPR